MSNYLMVILWPKLIIILLLRVETLNPFKYTILYEWPKAAEFVRFLLTICCQIVLRRSCSIFATNLTSNHVKLCSVFAINLLSGYVSKLCHQNTSLMRTQMALDLLPSFERIWCQFGNNLLSNCLLGSFFLYNVQ